MKAPVWFVIARADVFGGSTGWHRAALIDAAVKHFGDWWLVGIKDTGVWSLGATHLLADVTNQYIWQGVQGGLLTMLLFILIIVLCFRGIGREVRATRKTRTLPDRLCIWSLGAALPCPRRELHVHYLFRPEFCELVSAAVYDFHGRWSARFFVSPPVRGDCHAPSRSEIEQLVGNRNNCGNYPRRAPLA